MRYCSRQERRAYHFRSDCGGSGEMLYITLMNDAWVRDTGLVFVLISLVFAFLGSDVALVIAAVLILVTMLFPSLLWPLAWLWFVIAKVISNVMQRVFFGLIFFVVVTPVALLRRVLKGDTRALLRDKAHDTSFIPLNGLVAPEDMEHPY